MTTDTSKKTQVEFIRQRLEENGRVSRNDCLKHFITRVASRIYDLEQEGYAFDRRREGGDYVYVLKHSPRKVMSESELYELYG